MRWPLIIYRITRFEYWPGWLFYLPMIPYWLYLSVRMRSFSFFVSTNPGIELGGFFGESKEAILQYIAPDYLPKQFFLLAEQYAQAKALVELKELSFPLVAKPDVGERGNGVAKIPSPEALSNYLQHAEGTILLQEFIGYPEEFGVFYGRRPGDRRGKITSLTQKRFLSVIGDGQQTVEKLLAQSVRGRFQLKRLRKTKKDLLKEIPATGVSVLVEPIGNHCLGTEFLDGSMFITKELELFFDKVSSDIPGFYYGRFDVKATNTSDLQQGKGICILELNGISSEPGHIYDKKISLIKAYKVLKEHWRLMAEIARLNGLKNRKAIGMRELMLLYYRHVIVGKPIRKVNTEEDPE